MPNDFGDPAGGTSVGGDYAVYCTDSAFAWDKRATVAIRRRQYEAALSALPADSTAPFSPSAWTTYVKQQPVALAPAADACIDWPAPLRPNPPFAPATRFAEVPALVLNADLDLIPLAQAKGLTRLFPKVSFVEVGNAGHVTGFWSPCAAAIEVRFIATLDTGKTTCARDPQAPFHAPGAPSNRFVPFHGVRSFPTRAARSTPARIGSPGTDRSTRAERQVAAMAWSAVEDAILRSMRMSGRSGRGLRGGRFTVRRSERATSLRYHGARFSADVAVRGRAQLRTTTNRLIASVTVAGPGGDDGRLTIRGTIFDPAKPTASVRGRLGGHDISLRVFVN